MRTLASLLALVLLAACSSDKSGEPSANGGGNGGNAAASSTGGGSATGGSHSTGGLGQAGLPQVPAGNDAPSVSHPYTESSENFLNPERGFYAATELVSETDYSWVRETLNVSLLFSYLRLDDYRDAPIPTSLLADAQRGLDAVRAAGLKVVLRFAYNFGDAPDASKARVLEHINALKDLVHDNADVITLVQAGFIGYWGEWHHSTNGLGNDADRKAILEAVLAMLPPNRITAVRTPMYKQASFGAALTAEEAFGALSKARIGHHNDCFLASEDDWGTYETPIADWKKYVADDTQYVAMGGETCNVNPPRSECASALTELEMLHFSYLNQGYEPGVLQGFKAGGCYETLQKRLGYRLVLTKASYADRVKPGGSFALELDLKNVGFAAPYNPRPLVLVLEGNGHRSEVTLPGVEPRRWLPGASQVQVRLAVPSDWPVGDYRLAVMLPDEATNLRKRPEYSIRLANDSVWNATAGDNTLGTVTLAANAAGTATKTGSELQVVQ